MKKRKIFLSLISFITSSRREEEREQESIVPFFPFSLFSFHSRATKCSASASETTTWGARSERSVASRIEEEARALEREI